MKRKLRVYVDKAQCVSNQMCIQVVPGVFVSDADGKTKVGDVTAGTEEAILEAAFNCPVGAISVVDADTGEDLLG
jgi:ferredoxin